MRRFDDEPQFRTRRQFDYDRRLLPNEYLARLEPEGIEDPRIAARLFTGRTIGYPAWNLLYYALLCSLPGPDPDPPSLMPNPLGDDVVVIETGTNRGLSTIAMAQALKDAGVKARVLTVEIHEEVGRIAQMNVFLAGLSDHVDFTIGDSIEFLKRVVDEMPHVDFAFLDDDHARDHLLEEFAIVHPALLERRGTARSHQVEVRRQPGAVRQLLVGAAR
jgi:hypothetical protein